MPSGGSTTILCDHCKFEFAPTTNHPPILPQNFRSHFEPTSAEYTQTFAYIRDEEREVARYNHEISRLDKIVKKLTAERDCLQQRICERKNWTSPSFRIPKEVWCEIFTFACLSRSRSRYLDMEDDASDVIYITPKKSAPVLPLTLSHVSSYWRSVIFALPSLWSTLAVDLDSMTKGRKKLVGMCLRNAGSHPLELRVNVLQTNISQGYIDSEAQLNRILGIRGCAVLRMLMKATSRCRRFEMGFDSDFLTSIPDEMISMILFPLLETFECFCLPGQTEVNMWTEWFWEQIQGAPRLRRVTVPDGKLISEEVVPTDITTLSLGEVNTCTILSILTTYETLSSLHWRGSLALGRGRYPPVEVPHLRELSCSSINASDLKDLLSSVTLPSITSIEIDCIRDLKDRYWKGEQTLVSLLERSRAGASLKKLKLKFQESHVALERVVNLLRVCHSLTSLEVWVKHNDRHEPNAFVRGLLERLTIADADADQTILVPSLTHLRLYEVFCPEVENVSVQTQERLVRMAESRCRTSLAVLGRAVSVLRELSVSFPATKVWRDSNPYINFRCQEIGFSTGGNVGVASRVQELRNCGTECHIACIRLGSTLWDDMLRYSVNEEEDSEEEYEAEYDEEEYGEEDEVWEEEGSD